MALLLHTPCAYAESPLPTFDKEAVTDYPYMRTGEQEIPVDRDELPPPASVPQGNTGTEEAPAFFVKEIKLTGHSVLDERGKLRAILDKYSGRSLTSSDLSELSSEVMLYCRSTGYTIPLAVVPIQEVKDGVLELRIHVAVYDDVQITVNSSDISDRTLQHYVSYLKKGDVMTDRQLETAINNLNDLPGVQARAILRPGDTPGSTKVDIEVQKRKVWNNFIFADNGGSYYSGRYRLGFNTEIYNQTGEKFIVSGMITDEETNNYSVRYEKPVGRHGTRIGIAYSKTSYDFNSFSSEYLSLDSVGESEGVSVYGFTPLYRGRTGRLNLIYGYDRRDIKEDLRWREYGMKIMDVNKDANVWHIGITGSYYQPDEFFQYSFIYWYGDIDTDGGAYYDGGYHKFTIDFLKVWYDGRFNYRIRAKGQLASRALDGSEQFFLGGMNGVRAYANGDGYGDRGYTATAEVRYGLGIPGLELAAFIDAGAAKNLASGATDHLAGGGLGLRWARPNDWYFQLDYAHKINARADRTEDGDDDGRIWFQLYKMF